MVVGLDGPLVRVPPLLLVGPAVRFFFYGVHAYHYLIVSRSVLLNTVMYQYVQYVNRKTKFRVQRDKDLQLHIT